MLLFFVTCFRCCFFLGGGGGRDVELLIRSRYACMSYSGGRLR